MTRNQQLKKLKVGDWSEVTPISTRFTPSHLVKLILAVLFFGPLIAPLFQATYMPLVADSGALARDLLARYICPTPAKSYMLLGFPMAVCARCWGATIGLWLAWLLLRPMTSDPRSPLRQGDKETRRHANANLRFSLSPVLLVSRSSVTQLLNSYFALAWPLRLLLGALPFLLWVGEINLWAAAPYWVLLLNGALAGFWAGLFFYSIWPGLLALNRDL